MERKRHEGREKRVQEQEQEHLVVGIKGKKELSPLSLKRKKEGKVGEDSSSSNNNHNHINIRKHNHHHSKAYRQLYIQPLLPPSSLLISSSNIKEVLHNPEGPNKAKEVVINIKDRPQLGPHLDPILQAVVLPQKEQHLKVIKSQHH